MSESEIEREAALKRSKLAKEAIALIEQALELTDAAGLSLAGARIEHALITLREESGERL